MCAASKQQQLPDEHAGLDNGNQEQECRDCGQIPRIVGEPPRIEREPFINSRLFRFLGLGLLGIFLGGLSGQYFYRQRYLIGSALIGSGWLCILAAWWSPWGLAL
jgi:hypothetical protein